MTTNNPETNTNEKGAFTLYSSFLPILLLLGIIIGAGYFLLSGEFDFPTLGGNKTEVRRLTGYPTIVYTTDQVDKQRLVIKSQEELNTFLNTIDPTGLLVLNEEINFDKEYLIAATTETRPTDGYKLKIKRLYEDTEDQSLLVSLEETRPEESCAVLEDSNIPVDIVAIKKTDMAIDFERIIIPDVCE